MIRRTLNRVAYMAGMSRPPRPRRTTGFTMIEVLVALAIMTMIAAVITPVLFGALDRARIDRAIASLENLGSAIVSFYDDVGDYPARLTHLTDFDSIDKNSCGANISPGNRSKWAGPYVTRVLTTSGTPVGIGTAQNDLVRDASKQARGNNNALLKMVVPNVLLQDAEALNKRVDGDENNQTGSIQWDAGSDGFVTLYYAIGIKGC